MAGEEAAFWLMIGFSCLVGIFIGYLIFSPRERAVDGVDEYEYDDYVEDPDSEMLDVDTGPGPEPWLADKEALREAARERAMTRMAESQKRTEQEAKAARDALAARDRDAARDGTAGHKRATMAATDDDATDGEHTFFEPETIKAWDQVETTNRRRKPGTWVKASRDEISG